MKATPHFDISLVTSRAQSNVYQFITLPSKSKQWVQTKQILTQLKASNSPLQVAIAISKLITLHQGPDYHIHQQSFTILQTLISKSKLDIDKIITLALRIEELIPEGILPISLADQPNCFVFKDVEIASILSLAFFCCLKMSDLKYMPREVNFLSFYYLLVSIESIAAEKLKCYFNYFNSFIEEGRIISIHRFTLKFKSLTEIAQPTRLSEVEIKHKGKMNTKGEECLLIDFANKYIGGGAMGGGCVQEEILFLQYPELHIAVLLFQKMSKLDAIAINGIKKYNKSKGYGKSFTYKCPYKDATEYDEFHRLKTHIVAIDALSFGKRRRGNQFAGHLVEREINKALSGFSIAKLPIRTGHWGCGAFCGIKQLKFLIQWAAASVCGNKMVYYTLNDSHEKDITKVVDTMKDKTVCDILGVINYCNTSEGCEDPELYLFDLILGKLAGDSKDKQHCLII